MTNSRTPSRGNVRMTGPSRPLARAAVLLLTLLVAGGAWGEPLVFFFEDFESAPQDRWSRTADWRFKASSACLPNQVGYTSPSTSLAFDFGSLDNGCKYAPNRLGYATMTEDVSIPITTPTAKLNWWQFVGAEQGADFYFIQLSTDGGLTWPDEIYRDSTDNLFWSESSIDLTAYIGRSIRLRFGFSSDQSFESFGWYVDDITIEGETLGEGVSAVAIGNASITEGDSGTSTLAFPLDISPVNAEEIVLEHMTLNGTAVAGLDFLASSGPFIIPANTAAITLDVAVLGDAFLEADETLSLVISNPSPNAIITLNTGIGTVIDNEELVTLYEEGFEDDDGSISWLTQLDPDELPVPAPPKFPRSLPLVAHPKFDRCL